MYVINMLIFFSDFTVIRQRREADAALFSELHRKLHSQVSYRHSEIHPVMVRLLNDVGTFDHFSVVNFALLSNGF